MKRMILSLLALTAATLGHAQVTTQAAAATTASTSTPSATELNEWLPSFTAVVVDGPMDITFVKAPDTEAPKIVYDTRGSYTTKFKAEVRDKVLYIREKADSRRPERTVVTLRYNDLVSVSISDAVAKFDEPLSMPMLDLKVGARAMVTAEMAVKDLNLDASGESTVTLTGSARYLTLMASTGKVDVAGMACVSAQVNAQSKAQVRLDVTERLVAKASTGATIRYKGAPALLRTSSSLFAGDIKPLE